MSPQLRALTALALTLAAAPACTPSCNTFCESKAELIEFCSPRTQGAWAAVTPGDWSPFGASSREDFVAICQSDAERELASTDGDLEQGLRDACAGRSRQYDEWVENGICIELP